MNVSGCTEPSVSYCGTPLVRRMGKRPRRWPEYWPATMVYVVLMWQSTAMNSSVKLLSGVMMKEKDVVLRRALFHAAPVALG